MAPQLPLLASFVSAFFCIIPHRKSGPIRAGRTLRDSPPPFSWPPPSDWPGEPRLKPALSPQKVPRGENVVRFRRLPVVPSPFSLQFFQFAHPAKRWSSGTVDPARKTQRVCFERIENRRGTGPVPFSPFVSVLLPRDAAVITVVFKFYLPISSFSSEVNESPCRSIPFLRASFCFKFFYLVL